MAQPEKTPYSDFGVKIPYYDPGAGKEWSEDDRIQKDGFLLVAIFARSITLVQSIGTGKLYVNKLLEKGEKKSYTGRPRPPDFKVSTFWDRPANDGDGDGVGDGNGKGNDGAGDGVFLEDFFDDDGEDDDAMDEDDISNYAPASDDSDDELWEKRAETRIRGGAGGEGDEGDGDSDAENDNDFTVPLPKEPYFPHLVHWQKLGSDDSPVWSLYYKYVSPRTSLYSSRAVAFSAHAYRRWLRQILQWGRFETARGIAHQEGHARARALHLERSRAAWRGAGVAQLRTATGGRLDGRPARLAAGDSPRPSYEQHVGALPLFAKGRPPKKGERANAFPDIIAGDFGESHIDGDPARFARNGVYEAWPPKPGKTSMAWANELDRTNIDDYSIRVLIADKDDQGGPGYSDELVDMLETFEWRRLDGNDIFVVTDERDDGSHGYDDVPDISWVVDEMLPLARDKVAELADAAPDYASLDMSWTKPGRLMPYLCDHTTNLGVQRIRAMTTALDVWNDLRGPWEYQRLAFAVPTPIDLGYGAASAQRAAPAFVDGAQFDDRYVQRPNPATVVRSFREAAETLTDAMRDLAAREADRLDADEAPSDSDGGSRGGRKKRRAAFSAHESTHHHLAEIEDKVRELEEAIGVYQPIRNRLRDEGRGSPRPPSPPPDSSEVEDDDGNGSVGDGGGSGGGSEGGSGDGDGEAGNGDAEGDGEGMDVDNDADNEGE
ncbi:hypothetical protein PG988_014265 [Apiospora saccharicola]